MLLRQSLNTCMTQLRWTACLIAATTLTNQSNGVITYANGGTLSAGGAGQGTIVNEGQIVIDAGTVPDKGSRPERGLALATQMLEDGQVLAGDVVLR